MQRKPIRTRTRRAKARKAVAPASTRKKQADARTAPAPVPLTFRVRTVDDDGYILQLTEEQLGSVHQQAFGEPFPREPFLQYLRSGAPTFIVERTGKRIGYYSYLIGPDAKMHVSALVIEPAFQSEGVGTEVMSKLEDDARRAGVQVMEVFVQTENTPSMAFTRKLGFREAFLVDSNTTCFQKSLLAPGANGPLASAPAASAWSS